MQRNPETGLPMVDLDNQAIADEIIVLVKERDALKAENARFRELLNAIADVNRTSIGRELWYVFDERDFDTYSMTALIDKMAEAARAALTGRNSE